MVSTMVAADKKLKKKVVDDRQLLLVRLYIESSCGASTNRLLLD
jgi:hypothetical protein